MDRTTVAFLSTPLIIPLSYSVINFVTSDGRTFDMGGAFIIAIICYAWAFLIGFPLYRLVKNRSWNTWWQFALVGFIGGVPFGLLWVPFGFSMVMLMSALAAASSATCALAFWFISAKHPI